MTPFEAVKVLLLNWACCFVLCLQNGRLSKELDLVGHHVRTRLDELKRQEVSRLRMLLKAKLDSANTQSELLYCFYLLSHIFRAIYLLSSRFIQHFGKIVVGDFTEQL